MNEPKVPAEELAAFCNDSFRRLGLSVRNSRLAADNLIFANLRGVDSQCGVTSLEAGIRASLPFLVWQSVCLWADGLLTGSSDAAGNPRARKVTISAAFLSGLLIVPAAYTTSKDVALVLIMGGCLVGLSAANQLLLLPRDELNSRRVWRVAIRPRDNPQPAEHARAGAHGLNPASDNAIQMVTTMAIIRAIIGVPFGPFTFSGGLPDW